MKNCEYIKCGQKSQKKRAEGQKYLICQFVLAVKFSQVFQVLSYDKVLLC